MILKQVPIFWVLVDLTVMSLEWYFSFSKTHDLEYQHQIVPNVETNLNQWKKSNMNEI